MVQLKTVVCQQPIGNLYLFNLKMSDLTSLVQVKCRKDDANNVQRERNKGRVKQITKYSNSVDACMPCNILVNIDASKVKILGNTLDLIVEPGVLEILDGQHRVGGFAQSSFDYDVPIGAFIGLSNRQKARVFKAINFNAKQVSKSHVYDLLSLTDDGSEGERLAHEVCKLLNTDENSPFKGKVKMLGSGKGWFSQASLLKPLAALIDSGCLRNQDGGDVYQTMLAYFKAWFHTFPEEFSSRAKDSLLVKGFGVQVMLGCFTPIYSACHGTESPDYPRFLAAVQNFKDGVGWTREDVNNNTSKTGVNLRVSELLARL